MKPEDAHLMLTLQAMTLGCVIAIFLTRIYEIWRGK